MVGINRRKEITGKFDSLQWKIRDTSKYIDLDGIFVQLARSGCSCTLEN